MNDVIKMLLEKKDECDKKLKLVQYEMNRIERNLHEELFNETQLINNVLEDKMVDIISMINKNGLKVSSINEINGSIIYKVTYSSCYHAKFKAKDGTIVVDMSGIDNDGVNEPVKKKVKELLRNHIIPYCEKHKKEVK
jgi:hypothetical protein